LRSRPTRLLLFREFNARICLFDIVVSKQPGLNVFLDIDREQPERDAQSDSAVRRRHLRDVRRPYERLQCIAERIDDEIEDELNNLAVKEQPYLLEVLDKRSGL
jgi:hypothetical protein